MRKVLLEVNFACGAGSVTKLGYWRIKKRASRRNHRLYNQVGKLDSVAPEEATR
jgi:hypothetical protein